MAFEAILNEVEQLHDRQRASCDTGGATSVCVRAAKRKFRIVKRENNIPVLGVCEYCNAEFAADPETIGRPLRRHTSTFKNNSLHTNAGGWMPAKVGADRGRSLPNRTEHIGTPSITVAIRRGC
jgi:hypothetical protein